MSGGSMDYLYSKIQYMLESYEDDDGNLMKDSPIPERREFAAHLELVAKALREIEWVDSGDDAPGSEFDAIMEVLRKC